MTEIRADSPSATIVCLNGGARDTGAPQQKAAPAKAAPTETAITDKVCRAGQSIADLKVQLTSQTAPSTRAAPPEPKAGAGGVSLRTASAQSRTSRPDTDESRPPDTRDLMVGKDVGEVESAYLKLIKGSPELTKAAQDQNIEPEKLATLLAANSWQHAAPRNDGTFESPVFTDPGTITRLAANVKEGGPDAEQAQRAGSTVSESAIARMVENGVPLESAPRGLGMQIAKTADALHEFYSGTEHAAQFPAFTGETSRLTEGMINAGASGYAVRSGVEAPQEFSYDDNDAYADASDDFSEQAVAENPFVAPTFGYSDDVKAPSLANNGGSGVPLGAVGASVRQATVDQREDGNSEHRRNSHLRIADAGRALRNGVQVRPRFTRTI